MALEQAGVDLQARGFKQYIANLEAIEKQQREVFDQEFQGTTKSFSQVQKAAKDYQRQLQSLEKQYNQAVAQENKFGKATTQTASGVSSLNAAFGQLAIGVFTQQTAQAVIEATRMAAAFQGQTQALTNLAASYGQSGDEIRQAITRAADGVLSQTKIIDVALQGTQLQVAKTPEEFERLTAALIRIGQARGVGGQAAVERGFLGIGKRETELLDELGITTRQINTEMEKLAERDFGKTAGGLSTAQREALFVEAAITVAEQAAERFGDSTVEAARGFERVTAEAENLELVLGTALLPTTSEFGNLLADALITAQQLTALVAGGAAGIGSILQDISPAANVGDLFEQFRGGEITLAEFLFGTGEPQEDKSLDQILRDAGEAGNEVFKNIARAQGITFPEDIADEATESIEENTEAAKENEAQIKTLQAAIRQAEQLELSFARAAEDAARRLGRQQAKLGRDQLKDRLELLDDQAKEFDKFQQDEIESVQEAQEELSDAQQKAAKEQIQDQDKLFRELRQARDRFNLDTIQSQRRFQLQDRRLRASGDILALQELREDFALQQLENKENFDLQQGQRKDDAKSQEQIANEQRQEQIKQLEQQVNDLQGGLDQRRTEFLAAQEEELNALLVAQAEQRQSLQESYLEQQEDARINQQRQIEDLGRALATQEGITAEGTLAIAGEIEKIFGQEGVADTIFAGFTARTESEFQTLFDSVEEIINKSGEELKKVEEEIRLPVIFKDDSAPKLPVIFRAGGSGSREIQGGLGASSGAPSFADGGIVPGARGSPQLIQAHGGETVLPTHRMSAPLIPSQTINLQMGGGFEITGGEAAGEAVVRAAVEEMTDNVVEAVKRLTRRI